MAGTTGSTGLNNFLESSNQVQTTLPSWYDAAQQNIVNQAGTAQGQTPAFQNTTAQGAVNTLQGNANPFTQAQGTLNQIATGAANPWITDPTTGTVTPNTSTAMGGLFEAQRQQLNQLMPTTLAPVQAGAIGSGNFGSLRGDTAVDTAKTNAFDTLAAQQMAASLQNQQTGSSAAGALGNVGAQGVTADLTTGAAQMNAPFQGATNYANLVNSINVPGTVTQQNQESPLQMMSALAGAPTTAGNLLSSIFGSSSTSGTLANALKNVPGLSSLFGSGSSGTGQGQTTVPIDTSTGGYGNPVAGTGANGGAGAGQVLSTDGNIYTDPSYGTGGSSSIDPNFNPYENPI
jgi:hypothetical protein